MSWDLTGNTEEAEKDRLAEVIEQSHKKSMGLAMDIVSQVQDELQTSTGKKTVIQRTKDAASWVGISRTIVKIIDACDETAEEQEINDETAHMEKVRAIALVLEELMKHKEEFDNLNE